MSSTINASSGYVPVFGTDIEITGYTGKLEVTGVSLSQTAEKAVFRDGAGDTRARIWYDLEQSRSLTLDVTVIGSGGSAAANNAPVAVGTQLTLTSTKYAYATGTWRVDDVSATGSNTGFATWSITLVPELS